MNFFINQGRCRVCGRILCCSNHQKEHERLEHKNYVYLLDKLPTTCKKCCRNIYSIHDLHFNCHPFMNQRLLNGKFNNAVMVKSNRKRTLNQARKSNNDNQLVALPLNERKKLVPVYKFKRMSIRKLIAHSENNQQTLVIEVNQMLLNSTATEFSPHWNISYKMVMNSIVTSSTPLNEGEKENIPAIFDENFQQTKNVQESLESTVYHSPELFQSPLVIISAKKNTPPGIISNFSKRVSKKVLKNRRVTFELVEGTESEESFTIYGTPAATMEVLEDITEQREVDLMITSSSPKCLLLKIMRSMRSAMNYIPRTVFTAWDWSNKKFKNLKTEDDKYNFEIRSPLKKRLKYDTANSLIRKPITSYWVNMSVNSLFRKPLPNYVHRFHND